MNKIVEVIDDILELIWGKRPKPKRIRNEKGQFMADDWSTKDKNEAWAGGKAPDNEKEL